MLKRLRPGTRHHNYGELDEHGIERREQAFATLIGWRAVDNLILSASTFYGRFQYFRLAPSFESFEVTGNMFYIIGLGLCDEKDITVRGLEVSFV